MLRRIFCKLLLVAAVVFSLLAFSGVLFAQGRSENGLERAIQVQERNTERLMSIDGVVGTAVGLNPGGRFAVAVLLEKPGIGGIPQQLEGVPVHPVVTGKIYALPKPPWAGGGSGNGDSVDPTARFDRPVPIGVSTGHPAITAGTISCRVTDGTNVYALSNNHVYADENNGISVLNSTLNEADNVLQPGPYDGGVDSTDAIGKLYDFEPIDFSGDNTIDAAIALSSTNVLGNSTPTDGYGTPKSTTKAAQLNLKVKKYGRTTGLTKGQVYAINATVDVGYDSGVARFVKQIVITPGSFSAGGDSGSLIVVDGKGRNKNDDRKPVGLLFAGSDLYTIANPIDDVLKAFGVSIDGE
jgi:hypothetical protein